MVEYTDENMEKLADIVIDSWDMQTLLEYARDRLIEAYDSNEDLFNHDWKIMVEGE